MPTKLEYRQAVARRINGFGPFTGTGGDNDEVICTPAFASSVAGVDYNQQVWLFAPGSLEPRQRRIASVNTSTGTALLDGPLGSSFAGGGIAFELHSRLPGKSDNSVALTSVDDCVQTALQHISPPRVITLDLVSGQQDYGVPEWFDRPERLVEVREPNATNGTMLVSPRTWSYRSTAGGTNSLHVDAPYRFAHGSFSIEVEARAPADTLINGAESSTGLVAEDDWATPPIVDVVEVALVYAYEALALSEEGALSERYARLVDAQLAEAQKVRWYDRFNPIVPNRALVGGAAQAPVAAA